jgi:hypothetical protein
MCKNLSYFDESNMYIFVTTAAQGRRSLVSRPRPSPGGAILTYY